MNLKKKPTSDQLKEARKGGFNTKRPEKPKAGTTFKSLESWGKKYNSWVSKVHSAVTSGKAKAKLIQQIRSI